ncbi:hypothetical protein C5E45_28300 [Nocardia nova]|uniref:Uncharacterized protein n=1 Tax=Nocardia nova TaxID=37330 RepID=A0A2S6AI57_9NOCA|nr:hypothetical protein [Nocardia nova]PPJ24150.1 hypothetical protein C5E41_22890 [Nocardia nova]PPJ34920.1 hypothetical protein C5E45_28300 [Nocardia nova]
MTESDQMFVVGKDGAPRGMVDVDRLQSDATLLMYEMAAAAGNDAAVDRIGIEWAARLDPDAMGYTAAGALSLMTRNILAPLLEVLDRALPELKFREKLAECRDDAARTLGGGR